MNEPVNGGKFSVVLVRVTETGPATHSLEDAARLAGVHPEMLRHYCRLGQLCLAGHPFIRSRSWPTTATGPPGHTR